MRYAYRYERYDLDHAYDVQPLIDEMGSAGWRIHTMFQRDNRPFSYDILFERELE